MDVITTAAVAYVTKDGIQKLLGPTFEYYGIGLKNTIESFNQKAKDNLNNPYFPILYWIFSFNIKLGNK